MYIFKEVKFAPKGLLSSNFARIYGLGYSKSFHLLEKLGFNRLASVQSLNLYRFNSLIFFLKKFYMTENVLKRSIYLNIQNKINLNTYVGFRHISNLPTRGQRTHTNAKTSRSRKILKVKV
jgi:small subunit ribosomal protein S13